MSASAKRSRIDESMELAEAALKKNKWFEAERCACKALSIARQVEAWESMARIVLPLQEARRQRLSLALDTKKILLLTSGVTDTMKISKGCYLVQPPLVGADARRLRVAALREDTPVAVMCREPLTRLKQCPVVAIGAVTIRTRIAPPKSPDKPSMEWFTGAMEALGDAAIESIDTGVDLDRQIDQVMACLDAFPDHEKLHQLLEEMCRTASRGFERRMPPRTFEDEIDEEDEVDESAPVNRNRAGEEDDEEGEKSKKAAKG